MANPPPRITEFFETRSPSATVFNTPQQTPLDADYTPPPVSQVAIASLRLAFQTPSTSTIHSSVASAGTEEYDDEEAAAAGAAAAAATEAIEQEDSSSLLPSYLLRLGGRNDLGGVNLNNVMEEAAELGDGGDSDVEGDDALEHDVALNATLLERMTLHDESDAVEDADDNRVVLHVVLMVFCQLLNLLLPKACTFPIRQLTGSLQAGRPSKANQLSEKSTTLGIGRNLSSVLSLAQQPQNNTSGTVFLPVRIQFLRIRKASGW
jgi:hypothetical protein